MKHEYVVGGIALVMGWFGEFLGGFDNLLKCMMFLMLLDIVAGVLSAAIFNTSKYSKNGITSNALLQGAIRKIMMLFIVAAGVIIDKVIGGSYVRNCVVLYFIGTEGISLLEHMVHMNVPFPKFIKDILTTILEQADKGEEK